MTNERAVEKTIFVIQVRDPEGEWLDEVEIAPIMMSSSPESYFMRYGRNSGFQFRLVERKTVSHISEVIRVTKEE